MSYEKPTPINLEPVSQGVSNQINQYEQYGLNSQSPESNIQPVPEPVVGAPVVGAPVVEPVVGAPVVEPVVEPVVGAPEAIPVGAPEPVVGSQQPIDENPKQLESTQVESTNDNDIESVVSETEYLYNDGVLDCQKVEQLVNDIINEFDEKFEKHEYKIQYDPENDFKMKDGSIYTYLIDDMLTKQFGYMYDTKDQTYTIKLCIYKIDTTSKLPCLKFLLKDNQFIEYTYKSTADGILDTDEFDEHDAFITTLNDELTKLNSTSKKLSGGSNYQSLPQYGQPIQPQTQQPLYGVDQQQVPPYVTPDQQLYGVDQFQSPQYVTPNQPLYGVDQLQVPPYVTPNQPLYGVDQQQVPPYVTPNQPLYGVDQQQLPPYVTPNPPLYGVDQQQVPPYVTPDQQLYGIDQQPVPPYVTPDQQLYGIDQQQVPPYVTPDQQLYGIDQQQVPPYVTPQQQQLPYGLNQQVPMYAESQLPLDTAIETPFNIEACFKGIIPYYTNNIIYVILNYTNISSFPKNTNWSSVSEIETNQYVSYEIKQFFEQNEYMKTIHDAYLRPVPNPKVYYLCKLKSSGDYENIPRDSYTVDYLIPRTFIKEKGNFFLFSKTPILSTSEFDLLKALVFIDDSDLSKIDKSSLFSFGNSKMTSSQIFSEFTINSTEYLFVKKFDSFLMVGGELN